MNNISMYIEFSILCLWTLLLAWATLKGIQVPLSISTAYTAFVATAAVKVTWGGPSNGGQA
jgi:hypothetical protein